MTENSALKLSFFCLKLSLFSLEKNHVRQVSLLRSVEMDLTLQNASWSETVTFI